MALELGTTFEHAVAKAVGLDPAAYDPGSMVIELVNPSGPTTVRFTSHYALNTTTLQGLIRATLPAATP
jgi:hypothetical protein